MIKPLLFVVFKQNSNTMKSFQLTLITLVIMFNLSCVSGQEKSPINKLQSSEKNDVISIGKKFTLHSKILGEDKEIYISLPHKYEEHVQSYPVIFTLEAELLFESAHTITKFMAARSKMPQSIVIGIANGEYKKRNEMGFKRWGAKPDLYLKFIEQELIPYLESNYRANQHRTIIGLSPTTGLLFEAFFEKPELFKGYIALSAHLEWDIIPNSTLIDKIISTIKEPSRRKTTLYLGRADSDLKDAQYIQKAFDDAIHKLKNEKSITNCIIDVLEKEEHYLMAIRGIRAGLESIYPNNIWRDPGLIGWDKNKNYARDYYKSYYDNLSSMYGFDIFPVEDGHAYGYYLTGVIYNATRWGTNKQVIDLAELGISYYPNSAKLHIQLAEAYKKDGKLKKAYTTAEKAIQLVKIFHPNELNAYLEKFEKLKK